MIYMACKFLRPTATGPVLSFHEMDDARWETRRIEVYRDGRIEHGDRTEQGRDDLLSILPLPTLDKIAAQPQFEPRDISREEFEREWARRVDTNKSRGGR